MREKNLIVIDESTGEAWLVKCRVKEDTAEFPEFLIKDKSRKTVADKPNLRDN
jgi:glycine cleavage system H lipoate-binding protein